MKDDVASLLRGIAQYGLLTCRDAQRIADQTNTRLSRVEDGALKLGIIPQHYQRNIGAISAAEQQVLLDAKVAVIGCGGLGGYVLEQLARLGVGSIFVWDDDVFEEHNLNRQILADMSLIGQIKVEAAARRLNAVNPAVNCQSISHKFKPDQDTMMLKDCQVVVDALDNIPDRLALSGMCRELGIPLVHGAAEGWIGQLTTQFPDDWVIEAIYNNGQYIPNPPVTSTLAYTPALVASLQVAETIKILLNRGELLRGKIMLINLLDMDFETVRLSGE